MKLIFKLGTILLFFCILALTTHAQIPTSIDGVNINANPENPRPGDSIEISVESFNFDLNSASIVWIVDGKTKEQGIGLKNIKVIGPKTGISMVVRAIIKTIEGREIQKNITIKTGSVDIIWESSGYTPPFFKGKLPFAYQNTVRFIAIPHIGRDGVSEMDPKTLVYSWKLGGKYIDGGQGYGKQSVEVQSGDIPKPLDVSVEVYNREQTVNTVGYITLEPAEPNLSFYEEDALYGVLFNKSLSGRVQMKNSEMKILAVPYGFAEGNTYNWSINNAEQTDLLQNRSIVVRTKGDTDGSSSIDLDVRNIENILQGVRNGFTVYFTKKIDQ